MWFGGEEDKSVDICQCHDLGCIRKVVSNWFCPAESVRQQSLVVIKQVGLGIRKAWVRIPAPSLVISADSSEPQEWGRPCALKSSWFRHLLVV